MEKFVKIFRKLLLCLFSSVHERNLNRNKQTLCICTFFLSLSLTDSKTSLYSICLNNTYFYLSIYFDLPSFPFCLVKYALHSVELLITREYSTKETGVFELLFIFSAINSRKQSDKQPSIGRHNHCHLVKLTIFNFSIPGRISRF